MPTEGEIDAVVQECFERGNYQLVQRDEAERYSIINSGQLPTVDIPSGGVMRLPLDAYLRSKGVEKNFARRIHNFLVRYFPATYPFCMRVATRRTQDLERSGYTYSRILTVGGLVAYLQEHILEELGLRGKGIGPKSLELLTEHVINGEMKEGN